MTAPKRKLSDVLLELVEPYLSEADSGEKLDQLIATAVVAWNASLLPARVREESLREASRETCGTDRESADLFTSAVRDLIRRKQRLFPGDERVVVNYRLKSTHGKDSLEVASLSGVNRHPGEFRGHSAK